MKRYSKTVAGVFRATRGSGRARTGWPMALAVLMATGAVAEGGITVGSGTTFGGNGPVATSVTVNGGGILSPGVPGANNGIGTLLFSSGNNLTMNAGSILNLDFAAGGLTNDQVNLLAGTFTLTGAVNVNVLQAGAATTYAMGGRYSIFSFANAGDFSGTVSNLQVVNNTASAIHYVFGLASNGTNSASQIVLDIAGGTAGYFWSGAGGDGSWDTGGNWLAQAMPGVAGDAVTFGTLAAGSVVALNGDRRLGSIVFNNASGYSLTPGTSGKLFLDNGTNMAAISVLTGSHSITTDMELTSNASIAFATASNTLTLAGAISNGSSNATAGLSIVGPGKLLLTGANSYAGSTTIGLGTSLQVGNNGITGNLGGGAIIDNGSLVFKRGDTIVQGNIFSGTGSLIQAGSGTLALGSLNGFGGALQVTAGTLVYAGTSNFLGATTVAAGTLRLGAGAVFGGGSLALNGLLDLNGNNVVLSSLSGGGLIDNVSAGGAVGLTINASSNATFGGTIANSSGILNLTKTGSATLTLSGPNTFTGTTSITGGALRVTSNTALGVGGTLKINIPDGNGVALILGNGVNLADLLAPRRGMEFSGPGWCGGARARATHRVEFVDVDSGGADTLSGNLTMTGGEYRLSTTGGSLTVTGSHDAGAQLAAVSRGDIIFAGNGALNSTNADGVALTSNGPLTLVMQDSALWNAAGINVGQGQPNAGPLTFTIQNSAQVNLSGTFDLQNMGASSSSAVYHFNGGTVTTAAFVKSQTGADHVALIDFNGTTIVAGSDSTDFLPAVAGLSGAIQGGGANFNTNGHTIAIALPLMHDAALGSTTDGGLTKSGPGTLTLTGVANYTGATTINQGLLVFGGSGAVGGGGHSVGALTGAGNLEAAANLTSGSILVNALQVDAGVTLAIRPAGGIIRVNSWSLAGTPGAWTGTLDLNDNALIITSADAASKQVLLATLQSQIAQAENKGAWSGVGGITSSTVAANNSTTSQVTQGLALVDNLLASGLGLTSFRGVTGLNSNTLIVAQAHIGDANLDGNIDIQDLNVVVAHWQQSVGALWSTGDFTGLNHVPDGVVDIQDLNAIVSFWQFGTGSSLRSGEAGLQLGGAAGVPEPGSVAWGVAGVAGLVLRRRRR